MTPTKTAAGSAPFAGFPTGKVRLTPVPAPFFTDLLPSIDHLGELKVTLFAIWYLDQLEGNFRFLTRGDFSGDERFIQGLGKTLEAAEKALDDALERAVVRGTLLRAEITYDSGAVVFYFLNSARGRAAVKALTSGDWQPRPEARQPIALNLERPNIFRLYEEHIGPLTPLIAETLRDAEKTYAPEWIEDALRIAVENNVRRWRYVEAILRSWQEEGRDDPNRGDSPKDRRRYVEGKYADFIEH